MAGKNKKPTILEQFLPLVDRITEAQAANYKNLKQQDKKHFSSLAVIGDVILATNQTRKDYIRINMLRVSSGVHVVIKGENERFNGSDFRREDFRLDSSQGDPVEIAGMIALTQQALGENPATVLKPIKAPPLPRKKYVGKMPKKDDTSALLDYFCANRDLIDEQFRVPPTLHMDHHAEWINALTANEYDGSTIGRRWRMLEKEIQERFVPAYAEIDKIIHNGPRELRENAADATYDMRIGDMEVTVQENSRGIKTIFRDTARDAVISVLKPKVRGQGKLELLEYRGFRQEFDVMIDATAAALQAAPQPSALLQRRV